MFLNVANEKNFGPVSNGKTFMYITLYIYLSIYQSKYIYIYI